MTGVKCIIGGDGKPIQQGDVVRSRGGTTYRAMGIELADRPDEDGVVGEVALYDRDGYVDTVPVVWRGGYAVVVDVEYAYTPEV